MSRTAPRTSSSFRFLGMSASPCPSYTYGEGTGRLKFQALVEEMAKERQKLKGIIWT
jgi:hypothetical protein